MQVTTPLTEELSRYLDLSALELKLTAQNMANVDTPGYRTVGFDFSGEMERSIGELRRREDGAGTSATSPSPEVGPVGGLLERPDGGDVSMDREGMKMAEAQLQFRTGVELLKQEFTRLNDAIREDQK